MNAKKGSWRWAIGYRIYLWKTGLLEWVNQNKRPKWSWLRAIGNSSSIKMTIFIPAIGYLVLFNQKLISFVQLSPIIFGTSSPENFDAGFHRLLMIYFGLVSLSVASLIYQFFCPQEIKLYDSSTHYISAVRDNLSANQLSQIENYLLFNHKSKEEYLHIGKQWIDNAAYTNRTELYYRTLNEGRLFLKIMALVLYAVGFILLLIPSLRVFWLIVRYAMRVIF
jgi:hypothetical protein